MMPPLLPSVAFFIASAAIAWGLTLRRQMGRFRRDGKIERAWIEGRAAFYKGAAERAAEKAARIVNALDAHPLALATFDSDCRLDHCNIAYAKLWDLPPAWLGTAPSLNDLLNRLREERRLPEQRNFAEWKRRWIAAMPAAGGTLEETWHLPSGKSVRLLVRRRAGGGFLHFCEDISRQLQTESALNLLVQVQRATLDTLDQGIAIFGTDGRLMVHNAHFAGMWRLTEMELTGAPHLADLMTLTGMRVGQDGIWAIVARSVNSPTPECCGEWERIRRADGRMMSLILSRLPNGATMANFTDITDLERYRLLQRETSLSATA
jgi:PAS domain-containing protein